MAETGQRSRLKSRYEQEIRPSLVERFGYSTPMFSVILLIAGACIGVE